MKISYFKNQWIASNQGKVLGRYRSLEQLRKELNFPLLEVEESKTNSSDDNSLNESWEQFVEQQ